MSRKLERDTSTPERRAWWDAVKAAAAEAPRLNVREREPGGRSRARELSAPPPTGRDRMDPRKVD